MIWLTWRQSRTQTLVAVGALAALAGYLIYLGNAIRTSYDSTIVGCSGADCSLAVSTFRDDYAATLLIIGALLIAVPGLIGIFWGAPLVSRELEERTDRLVWNQSVTRTRWLTVKLSVIGLLAVAVTGLLSLLLTWSASRYDQVVGDRFAALSFDARNIVPMGYALFAFVLGTVVGMVLRRTLPAMAITLAVFAALQIAVPIVVRQHLMTPVTTTVTLDADVMGRFEGLSHRDEGLFIHGYTSPGGWTLTDEAQLFKPDGTAQTGAEARACSGSGSRKEHEECQIAQHLHFEVTYHPGSRYWPFQWIELSLFVALSVLLAGFGFWWIRRRV